MTTYLYAILNILAMAVVETDLESDILSEYACGLTVSNRRYLEKIVWYWRPVFATFCGT